MGFKSKYSAKYKERAIQLAQTVGNNEAARQLGMDHTTLTRWHLEAEADGRTQTERDKANVQVIQEVRDEVLPLAKTIQLKVLNELNDRLTPTEGKTITVGPKDLAIILGIVTEKIALLEGKPGSIVEHRFNGWTDKDLRQYAETGQHPEARTLPH
jgi:transposase-like protein